MGGGLLVGLVLCVVLYDCRGEDTADFWGRWFAGAVSFVGSGVGWFCGGSGIARPRPEESYGGVAAADPIEEIDVFGFLLGGDVCCSNVACLVVAVCETIAFGEPPGAHPSVLSPLGLVLWKFSC